MTIQEILKEIYEETMDKVFAASGNYLMTIPKKGMEEEHARFKERAIALELLIEERGNGK